MARPLRIQYPGAWYHAMNRGSSRRDTFPTAADREDFLRLMADAHTRFRLEIHAFCLMGNHYHLLVRTPRPNLARAMRHLDGVYTQRFNRRHGSDGPLFRGRYRSVLVQADRHLLAVSRYIHLNPVDAGIAKRPEDYRFSSYRAYLDPACAPPWLQTSEILGWFGSIGARRQYRAFVEAGLDPGTRDFYGRSRLAPVLGDDGFREELRRRAALELGGSAGEIPDLGLLERERAVPLATIAREVCAVFGVSSEALRSPSRARGPRLGLVRGAMVHAARRAGGYRLREIAAWLGYASYAPAAQAAARFAAEARRDPTLEQRLQRVTEGVKS